MKKICRKCGEEKNIEDFHVGSRNKDGRQNVCKFCCKKERKKRYEENKDLEAERNKRYYEENKDKISKKQKDYADKNRDMISTYKKEYYQKNKEIISPKIDKSKKRENDKKYRIKHKKEINLYFRELRQNNEKYRFTSNIRSRINQAFKVYSTTGKIMKSGGYGIDYESIFNYLGPCPGVREEYHIDHIFPLSAFNFDDIEQVKLAFAPQNHQWLKVEDNLSKGDRYDEIAFLKYIKNE